MDTFTYTDSSDGSTISIALSKFNAISVTKKAGENWVSGVLTDSLGLSLVFMMYDISTEDLILAHIGTYTITPGVYQQVYSYNVNKGVLAF